jgi:hypothetical protein
MAVSGPKNREEYLMTNKVAVLKKEIEHLEIEYAQAQQRPQPDHKQVDHLYKKLKKAKKELLELESK